MTTTDDGGLFGLGGRVVAVIWRRGRHRRGRCARNR